MENTQISLFDLAPQEMETSSGGPLTVVKAQFKNSENLNWHDLFDGFDELYGITLLFLLGYSLWKKYLVHSSM